MATDDREITPPPNEAFIPRQTLTSGEAGADVAAQVGGRMEVWKRPEFGKVDYLPGAQWVARIVAGDRQRQMIVRTTVGRLDA